MSKKSLASNAREMRKTGGGTPSIIPEDNFGLTDTQVKGLPSRFDSDTTVIASSNRADQEGFELEEEELESEVVNVSLRDQRTTSSEKLPRYSNKKMLMTDGKNDMIELKTENIRLDNIYKQVLIEKEKMLMEKIGEKMELENRKLQLEVLKLEKEMYPDEF